MVTATKKSIPYVVMNLPLLPGSVDTVAEGFIGAEEEENLLISKIKLQSHRPFC